MLCIIHRDRAIRGQDGALVTHLPPTSEIGSSNHEPYVEKLVANYPS